MADEAFNGATCTWDSGGGAATLGVGLLDANYNESGADVDLSTTTSSTGEGRPGVTMKELSVTLLGHCTGINQGDTGAIALGIAPDDVTITIDPAYISSVSNSGSKDGSVNTAMTFRPWKSS